MDTIELANTLKQIAAEISHKVVIERVDTSLPLVKQGMDSLDMVDYVMAVESKFSTKIENEDYDREGLGIIDNMVAFLKRHGVS